MSNGYILLEGGAEFGGHMQQPDQRALELAGGYGASVAIIPAAAAPDQNHLRAGNNGARWFRRLGATDVTSLPLIDRRSADQPEVADALRKARLIYLLGGFPGHLAESLDDSHSWRAILSAYRDGAVVGGSSAGAMVLCQHFYDPYQGKLLAGLNLIPNICVVPHHDSSGKSWVKRLHRLIPDCTLVGIDEGTGAINDGELSEGIQAEAVCDHWTVYGGGTVTLYRSGRTETYPAGQTFHLPLA